MIRGNFIRENSKTATSECDFYKEPVRYVEPLDPALTTPTSCDLLRLDLKTSSMDSITYHDKNSPGKKTDLIKFCNLRVLNSSDKIESYIFQL